MAHFRLETHIDAPVELVFDLSRDIDFHQRSMQDSGERAVAGVRTGLIGLGESVTWKARHFGVPFTMTSRIEEMDRPRRFVDAQVSGPFGAFHHVHQFEARAGGTHMVDDVTFRSPLGVLGRLVDRLYLARYLEQLIAGRNQALATEAEARAR